MAVLDPGAFAPAEFFAEFDGMFDDKVKVRGIDITVSEDTITGKSRKRCEYAGFACPALTAGYCNFLSITP